MSRRLRRLHFTSLSLSLRVALAAAVCLAVAVLLATRFHTEAATPASGTVSLATPTLTYTSGPFTISNPTDQVDGVPTCDATHPCDDFKLTVDVPAGYDAVHYVKIQVAWPNQATLAQYDIFVYKLNPDDTLGPLVAANFFAVDPDVTTISAISGKYLLRIAPTIAQGDITTTTVSLEQKISGAPTGTGLAPRFENFQAPGTLGNTAGEPSLGVGLASAQYPAGRTMYQANTTTLRVTFDDCASPAAAAWENKTAPNTSNTTLDPILFTDRITGRTFASQLAGACSRSASTDDDGDTWVPSQGCGVPAGIDHQTLGGGPFNENATPPPPPHPTYPNAVYYCSQYGTNAASCARSDDGGLTFGPAVTIYLINCFGIHGHVKVAPDGTVYVPDSDCSTTSTGGTGTARQGLVFSEDNGITWSQPQLIPDSNPAPGIVDPSIGIGAGGTIYYGYANSNGSPSVAVGHKVNHQIVWTSNQDVGAALGIQNSTFPELVAGDDDRAAYAFLGTTTGGYYQDPNNFEGTWHLYIATTYDGGTHWTTVDATPNDPVQLGSICNSGTVICGRTPNDRNLLDFMDATVDREGRIEIAYPDGCITAACIARTDRTGPDGQPDGRINRYDNDQARKATIARQSGGRRLFAAFDPPEPSVPKAPRVVSATRDSFNMGSAIHLTWLQPDDGGSPITSYNVYRGPVGGAATFLTSVPASASPVQFIDSTADPTTGYFYRVTAVNAVGAGTFCGEFQLAGLASPCVLPGITVLTDATGDATDLQPNHDLQSVSIAEPNFGDGSNKLVFTIKVASLASVPAETTWRVNFTAPDNNAYYVDMRVVNVPTSANPKKINFKYGKGAADLGDAGVGSSYSPDGTIKLIIANSKVGNPAAGQSLTNITASVLLEGLTVDGATATPAASYTLVGNNNCPAPPPPPPPIQGAPRYLNYAAPEGQGDDAGEPSIGANWQTGRIMYESGVHTYRVIFGECDPVWEDRSAPTSATTLDPIMFTDHMRAANDTTPDRTIVSQLSGTNSLSSFTDDDGANWTAAEGGSIGQSGVDHQTIGVGPFSTQGNAVPPPHTYPNAVYYCSQDVADANCALSVDGGQTYGPAVPIFTRASCGGLHGHVKVGPDGTAYVPNKGCDVGQTVIASEDNGVTWTVRPIVPGSVSSKSDPSVGIANDGTIYLGYADNNTRPFVAVSHDHGQTWTNVNDVGAAFGISNVAFPAVVAGDADRAAFAFLGTPTEGDGTSDNAGFPGVWYLYVATTIDGGAHWTTVNATPNDPVQRGAICLNGTTCASNRNLLDFNDATIDAQGRVLVGYADGCVGQCINGTANSGTQKATIARQSGGRRMFAGFDPLEPVVPTGPRLQAATRDPAGVITVSWFAPDDGGAPLTAYKIYRGTASGQETFLAAIGANATTYTDITGDPATTYFYRVTAVNIAGEGPFCGEVSVVGIVPETPCIAPGLTLLTDGTGDATGGNPAHDIQKVSLAEPFDAAAPTASKLVFTIKVASLASIPPNTRWPLQFKSADGNGYWVDMESDSAAPSGASFKYGTFTINASTGAYGAPTTVVGDADAGSNYNADGTITIVIANNKIGNPSAGQNLTGFLLRVRVEGQAVAITPDNAPNGLSPANSYTVFGNTFCRPQTAPVAALNATPTSGDAPLAVNFDGSPSSDADAGDTVATYVFDFGDGSAPVTQGAAAVMHTYQTPGTYTARLKVADSRGRFSDNVAQATINVTQAPVSIAGTVTDAQGQPLSDVIITLTGTQSATVMTDTNGNYSLPNLAGGGTYTLTPSKQGYAFKPNQRTFNALITSQAANFVGVIPTPVNAGDLIISEFRLRGPAGGMDEFIELYNNTDAAITVGALDGSAGWALATRSGAQSVQSAGTVLNGAVIPPRGHYLVANDNGGLSGGYSLGLYPAGNSATAAPDATYSADIPDDAGVALFKSADAGGFVEANRIDAVGFANADALYREGAGLQPATGVTTNEQFSFVRRMAGTGLPRDTGDNAADFALVSTNAAVLDGVQSSLGAPGPENLSSPVQRNAQLKASPVDPGCSGGSNDPATACARVRDTSDTGPNKTLGTLSFRRRFTNRTGAFVNALRFRIVDITAIGTRASDEADLRALDSAQITVTRTNGTPVTIQGTTVEQPAAQALGGGINTSLVVALPGGALAPGAGVDVQLVTGVVQGGRFRFFINVEGLTSSGTQSPKTPGKPTANRR